MTDLLHAVAGFTPASCQSRVKTRRANGNPRVDMDMAGAMRGPAIAEFFITGLLRAQMEHHGASGKSWCGGTRQKMNGQDWIILTLPKRNRPIIGQQRGPKATTQ